MALVTIQPLDEANLNKGIARGNIPKMVEPPLPPMIDLIRECIIEHDLNQNKNGQGVSRVVIKRFLAEKYSIAITDRICKEVGKAINQGWTSKAFICPHGLGGKVLLAKPLAKKCDVEHDAPKRAPLAPRDNVVPKPQMPSYEAKLVKDLERLNMGTNASPTKKIGKENMASPVKSPQKGGKGVIRVSPLRPRIPAVEVIDLTKDPKPGKAAAKVSPLLLKVEVIDLTKDSFKPATKPKSTADPKPLPLAKQHLVNVRSPKRIAKRTTTVKKKAFVCHDPTVSRVKRRKLGNAVQPELFVGYVVSGFVAGRSSSWVLTKRLGSGGFGDVWMAQGLYADAGQLAAVKVEWAKAECPLLNVEDLALDDMRGKEGFATKLFYFVKSDFSFLGMPVLGMSCQEMLSRQGGQVNLKDVLVIAVHVLRRLEAFHAAGWLHRDIKPDNILLGGSHDPKLYFLVDFGLSKRFSNPRTGEHVAQRLGKGSCGTPRYASLNTHIGREQSRRDDLESLAYVLIFMAKGRLPWQGLPKDADIWQETYNIKAKTDVGTLALWLPPELGQFLQYARGLAFEAKPDYKLWRDHFRNAIGRIFPPSPLESGNFLRR